MATMTISVPANVKETFTAITLATGEVARLDASGSWNIYGNPLRPCGPAGSDATANQGGGNHNSQPWPQSGIPEGCLLVYLNGVIKTHFTGPPLLVTGPGVLGFGPNDNVLGDNVGALQVQITIPC